MNATDLHTALPEVMLALFAMAALMAGVYTSKDKAAPTILWATAAVMVVLAAWIGLGGTGERSAFGGMFIDDPFARFAKVAILLSAAAILLVGQDHMERRDLLRFEYPILVALSVLGMMVMVSSGDLIALYMGLELQSLALYVVAAMRRDNVKSTEAGLKYFVLGSLSSGLFLYGASLTYGFAGTTVLSGILSTLNHTPPVGLLFGLVFMIAALAFKVNVVQEVSNEKRPDLVASKNNTTMFIEVKARVEDTALRAKMEFVRVGETKSILTSLDRSSPKRRASLSLRDKHLG